MPTQEGVTPPVHEILGIDLNRGIGLERLFMKGAMNYGYVIDLFQASGELERQHFPTSGAIWDIFVTMAGGNPDFRIKTSQLQRSSDGTLRYEMVLNSIYRVMVECITADTDVINNVAMVTHPTGVSAVIVSEPLVHVPARNGFTPVGTGYETLYSLKLDDQGAIQSDYRIVESV